MERGTFNYAMRFSGFLLCLSVLSLLVLPAFGQSNGDQSDSVRTVYIQLDYIHVPIGSSADYLQMERDTWKPIHEERMKRGIIEGWNLYSVNISGPDVPYNYVTANVFSDFGKLNEALSEDVVSEVHSGTSMDQIEERTNSARELVHTEVWQVVETEQPDGEDGPSGRYLVVNFMDVPAGSDYLTTERDIWQPIHKLRMNKGLMNGWSVYELLFPSGSSIHYNYGTVDFYNDLSNMVEPVGMELMQEAHPDADEARLNVFMDQTNKEREIYRREIWELVDSAEMPDGDTADGSGSSSE